MQIIKLKCVILEAMAELKNVFKHVSWTFKVIVQAKMKIVIYWTLCVRGAILTNTGNQEV